MSVSVLYYKVTPEQINSDQVSELITHWAQNLPIQKQQKISKLYRIRDQLLSLAGLQLLKIGMAEFSASPFSLQQVDFPNRGKPFLNGFQSKIDFNISHSGDIVCCVISDSTQVGIDIEQYRKVEPNLFARHFKKTTTTLSKTQQADFFRFWTQNEAIIKAANIGSVFNIQDIRLEQEGGHYQDTFWYTYEIDITGEQDKEYSCHIACSDKISRNTTIKSKQIFQL